MKDICCLSFFTGTIYTIICITCIMEMQPLWTKIKNCVWLLKTLNHIGYWRCVSSWTTFKTWHGMSMIKNIKWFRRSLGNRYVQHWLSYESDLKRITWNFYNEVFSEITEFLKWYLAGICLVWSSSKVMFLVIVGGYGYAV